MQCTINGISSLTFSKLVNLYLSLVVVLSAPPEIDEYDLVDPVDILTPLEKSGFWDRVVSDLFPSLIFCMLCYGHLLVGCLIACNWYP